MNPVPLISESHSTGEAGTRVTEVELANTVSDSAVRRRCNISSAWNGARHMRIYERLHSPGVRETMNHSNEEREPLWRIRAVPINQRGNTRMRVRYRLSIEEMWLPGPECVYSYILSLVEYEPKSGYMVITVHQHAFSARNRPWRDPRFQVADRDHDTKSESQAQGWDHIHASLSGVRQRKNQAR